MRTIARLIAFAVVVAAIAFFAAPAVGFFAIRAAADARDVQGLAQLVDYGALRASLRPQLSPRAEVRALAPPPPFLQDPVGAIRRQLQGFDRSPDAVRPPDVEAYLTPRALAALTRGQGRGAVGLARIVPAGEAQAAGADSPWPRPLYWGVNRVRMGVDGAQGQGRTIFTFERRGLYGWRLVHVGLPDPTTAAPAAAGAAAAPGGRRLTAAETR